MSKLQQLLRYLERPDIAEVVLQTGQPVAVVQAGALHPVSKQALTTAHVEGLIVGTPLVRLVPSQDTAGQPADVVVEGVRYRCTFARRGERLQVRVALAPDPAPAPAAPAQAPTLHDDGVDDPTAIDPAALLGGPALAPAFADEGAPVMTPTGRLGSGPAPVAAGVPDAVAREVSQPIVVEEATRAAHDGSLLALLQAARSAGATDVVLVSDRPALVRRVGALRPGSKQPLSTATIAKMVLPLLSPAQRAQYDERGYADFASELPGVARLRVNVCRQRTGIKATFRILAVHAPSLEQLGLPRDIQVISRYHQGLVVVSGPSGHGKTTTMAAIVDYFNTHKAVHIITVEDPVEILHPVKRAIVSQREVGIHTASFYAALKAALREDPDVIAIGELRDRETVEMALSAAETGHLVVATMSTPSGAKTIDRMINLFPPDDQPQVRATLAGALKLVVSQRLLPAAGGQGMVAAAEMITGNFALWNLIKDNKLFQLSSLMQRGRAAGMLRLEDSLSELVQAGAVDLAVAQSYADDPRLVIAEAPAPAAEPAKPARGFMRG